MFVIFCKNWHHRWLAGLWILLTWLSLPQLLQANFKLAEKAFTEGLYDFAFTQYKKVIAAPHQHTLAELETAAYYSALSLLYNNTAASANAGTAKLPLEQAEQRLSRFLTEFPTSRYKLPAQYHLSLALQEQGKLSAAFSNGAAVLNVFAETAAPAAGYTQTTIKTVLRIMLLSVETLSAIESAPAKLEAFNALLQQLNSKISSKLSVDARAANIVPTGDILVLQGNLLTQKGDAAAAADSYQQALSYPLKLFTQTATRITLIKSYLAAKAYAQAETVITETLYATDDPALQAELKFFQVQLSYLRADYARAIVGYKRYLRELAAEENTLPLSSYAVEAQLQLALAYQQTQQPILAVKTLKQVLTSYELRAYHYRAHEIALTLYKLSNDETALLETTEELLRLADTAERRRRALKQSIQFISRTGRVFDFVNDPTALLRVRLEEYATLETDAAQLAKLYFTVANNYYKNDKLNTAIRFFITGHQLSGEPRFMFALIEAFIEKNRYNDALTHALKFEPRLAALDQPREYAYLTELIGFSYLRQAKPTAARRYYERNAANAPLDLQVKAIFHLGELASIAGTTDKAIVYYRQVLNLLTTAATLADDVTAALTPRAITELRYQTYLHLGKLYEIHLAQPEQALAEYAQALSAAQILLDIPAQNHLQLKRAEIYFRADQLRRSALELERVNPQDLNSYYQALLQLANIYFNQTKYNKALATYIRIINAEEHPDTLPPAEILEQAYYERIRVKLKSNAPSEAFYFLGKLELRFPQSVYIEDSYAAIADFFYRNKDWHSAVRVYTASIAQAQTTKKLSWELNARFYGALAKLKLQTSQEQAEALTWLHAVISKSEAAAQLTPLYLEACTEAAILNSQIAGNLTVAHGQFQKIIKHVPAIRKQFPESIAFIDTLHKQATENIERINRFTAGSPFADLKTVAELKDKLSTLNAPALKAEGAERIVRLHIAARELDEAMAYLVYARELWPVAKVVSIELMKALLSAGHYDKLYELSLAYFLSDYFGDEQVHLEFLYYAAAQSATHQQKARDSARFKEKLKTSFPQSLYLEQLD